MIVKVRALVIVDGRVLVARETRSQYEHLTIPGGRPKRREGLHDALVREVEEETGARVDVGPLRYVAEVVVGVTTQEVNLVFAANAAELPADVLLVGPHDPRCERVMPPLLAPIFADLAADTPPIARFLGNVRQTPPRRRPTKSTADRSPTEAREHT